LVAGATVFGVPVRAPVVVSKLIPGGVALMLKLAIAPPVEFAVNPVATVFTVLLSEDEDKVNAGAITDVIDRLVPSLLTATNKLLPNVIDHQLLASAARCEVQVSPLFVLRITRLVPPVLTATNTPLPNETENQVLASAAGCEVQFAPLFVLRIMRLVPSVLTATNTPLPNVTERHELAAAEGLLVQVTPLSVLLITRLVPLLLTATNKLFPYVTENQLLFSAGVLLVQLIPSELHIATERPTATKTPLPYVTEVQG
jgi:hypothetical protein